MAGGLITNIKKQSTNSKIMVHIRDPIHGDIHFQGVLEELIKTEEFQRLADVKQLGLTDKVYPGASHTRFSHSMGVCFMAGELAKKLKVPERDVLLIQIAALLHDVGHYDFSHALERIAPVLHEDNSFRIIRGEAVLPHRKSGEISKILRTNKIDPEDIVGLLLGTEKFPKFYHSILSGQIIDMDRMDYLKRDTYYTGAVIGEIDVQRLIHVLIVHKETGQMAILEKGLASLEQFLMARLHMYRQVYMHKDSLIGELMLEKAVKISREKAMPLLYGDGHLLAKLVEEGKPMTKHLVSLVRAGKRAFYKPALGVTQRDEYAGAVLELYEQEKSNPGSAEKFLLNETGLQEGEIIVQFLGAKKPEEPQPFPVLLRSGEWVDLFEISPLCKAVFEEKTTDFMFGTYCAEDNVESVKVATEKLLKL